MQGQLKLKRSRGSTLYWNSSWTEIKESWESMPCEDRFFLSSLFCQTAAEATSDTSKTIFVLVKREDRVIMKAFASMVEVELLQSLSEEEEVHGLYARVMRKIRRGITKKLKGTMLNFGHIILSGERGFAFDESLNRTEQVLLLQEVCLGLFKSINKQQKLEVIFVKDLHERNNFDAKNPMSCQFSPLSMPPAMYIKMQSEWGELDNYLATFKSKYRVRVRKAIKRGAELRTAQMTEEEIAQHSHRLHELYEKLAEDAVFNLFSLGENYLSKMKKGLGDRFHVYGIWDGEKLVGFYSIIVANTILEAHFVGYEPEYVGSHDIYLNMLVAFIKLTIKYEKEHLFFARTAEEIKSSVGATPVHYRNYLRHRQLIPNQIIPIILHNIMPEEKYQLRNPFKAS